MNNKFYFKKTLFTIIALLSVIDVFSQFSGAFAPANWNFNSTTAGGDGSVNTSGAPNSIILSGSDNGVGCCSQYEQYSITMPYSCYISFNFSHSNPDIDAAYYVINGTTTLITNNGSGSLANILVYAGDVFSFRVFNQDNCCGRGVLTISNFVISGAALNFDGGDDFVNIGSVIPLNSSYTKEAWVYANASGSNNIISSASAPLWIMGGKLSAYNNATPVFQDPAAFPLNQWVHVAVTYNASTSFLSLYKNGILVNSGVTGAGYPGDAIAIGQYGTTGANFFQGGIDEVRIWNRELCISEIQNNMNAELPSGQTGLLSYYKMNQGIASMANPGVTTLTDASGNSNNAPLSNFTLNGPTSNWIAPGGVITGSTAAVFNSPISASAATTSVTCNGSATGSATITATGGAPYTYSWSPSVGTTSVVSGLAAGNYTVIVTGVCGVKIVTLNITAPGAITVTPVSQTNVACFGGSNGAASISASGGMGTLTYNWNPGTPAGDLTNSITGLVSGTYSCTVTDANGCVKTSASFNVTQPASSVSGTKVVTNVACFGGSNGAINLTPSGGTPGYTFNWLPSGPTTEDRTGLTAGTYTVQITDANGCTGTVNAMVTQPTSPTSGTTVITNVACFGGSNGAINLTPSGGTPGYTFNWLPSGPTTEDRTGLTAGTYTVQITDANGCTGTVNATVTQPTSPTSGTTVITNVACFGGSNGAINLTPSGGTLGYTFNWLPSGPTTEDRTGLTAGTYTVQITDANGCTGTVNATVTQPTSLIANSTASPILCNGGMSTITVTATGGTTAYTGVGTFTTLAGTKTYTVTDANGCSTTTSVNISQPSILIANSTASPILCNGGMSTVTITATGGTIAYTGVGTFTALAGTQTYTVTDANSCSATTSVNITQPTALTANSTASSILCNGGMSTVTVTATGGTTAYTGVGTFTALAGTQTYTVTDANSCSTTTSVNITQPSALTANSTASSILCNGGTSTVTVSVTGGTTAYTGVGTFTALAGTQTYTVTDANSCMATTSVSISEPAAIASAQSFTLCQGQSVMVGASTYSAAGTFTDMIASLINGCDSTITTNIMVNALPIITVPSATICAGATGTLSASGANTYTWSTGSNANAITASPAINTTYTVNGTSVDGCLSASATTATITVGAAPSIVVNSSSVCAGNSATLSASGVTSYTWSTGSNASVIVVTPTVNTTYTVSGNLIGCGVGATNNVTVTVNALPTVMATTNSTLLCVGQTASLTASGATSYTWNTNATTTVIAVSPTTTTVYTVTGVTANGCSNIATVTQSVSSCAGIQNVASSASANTLIYPNPTSGILNIDLGNATDNVKIEIMNALGQVVLSETTSTQYILINIAHLDNGIYFVKISQQNSNHIIKLVKQN
jgi:hypothetical protein